MAQFAVFLTLAALAFSAHAQLMVSCISDLDCQSMQFCDVELKTCQHDSLSESITAYDYVSFACFFILSVLAVASGVGGGLLYLPLLVSMLSFDMQDSAPISTIQILVTSVTRWVLAIDERYPGKGSPVINYDMAAVFAPPLMMGTIIGILCNNSLPLWMITIFLVCVFSVIVLKTVQTGLSIYEAEQIQIRNKNRQLNLNVSLDSTHHHELQALKSHENLQGMQGSDELPLNGAKDLNQENLIKYYMKRENRMVYWDKVFHICLALVGVVFFILIKGSRRLDSLVGVELCSTGWWLLSFAYFPLGIGHTLWLIRSINREFDSKKKLGWKFGEQEFAWTLTNLFKVACYGFITGLVAATFGVGGSTISNPIMLQLGMIPLEANFTGSFMTLYTSLATLIQYLLIGDLYWLNIAVYSALTLSGTMFGMRVIMNWIKTSNKQSLLVFFLSFVLFASILSVVYSNFTRMIFDERKGRDIWSLHSVC